MIKHKNLEFDTSETDTSTHLQGQLKDSAAVFEGRVWWVIDVLGFKLFFKKPESIQLFNDPEFKRVYDDDNH